MLVLVIDISWKKSSCAFLHNVYNQYCAMSTTFPSALAVL